MLRIASGLNEDGEPDIAVRVIVKNQPSLNELQSYEKVTRTIQGLIFDKIQRGRESIRRKLVLKNEQPPEGVTQYKVKDHVQRNIISVEEIDFPQN